MTMNGKKILAFIFGISVLCMGGCSNNTTETTEENISTVSITEDFTETVTELIENYFRALKEHSHSQLTEYTTSDYIMNYNQTYFDEFTLYISDCTVDEINFGCVQNSNNKFTVPVRYTIVYSEDYITDNSNVNDDYSYYDDFVIEKTDDETYKISSSEHKGVG